LTSESSQRHRADTQHNWRTRGRVGGGGGGDVHLAYANNVDARILHTVACGHILEARVTSAVERVDGRETWLEGQDGAAQHHQVVYEGRVPQAGSFNDHQTQTSNNQKS
jgi:hypothetical protein